MKEVAQKSMEKIAALSGKVNDESIEFLNLSLKRKIGIDFAAYRNEEIAETAFDIILFPKYLIKYGLYTVLAVAAAFIFALILLSKFHLAGIVLWAPFGLIFSLLSAFFLGPVWVIRAAVGDLSKIITLSSGVAAQSLSDLNNVRDKVRDRAFELPSFAEIFIGAAYIAVLPSILSLIRKKIPVIGNIPAMMIKKFFSILAGYFVRETRLPDKEIAALPAEASEETGEENQEEEAKKKRDRLAAFCRKGIALSEKMNAGTERIARFAAGVFSKPFLFLYSLFSFAFVFFSVLWFFLVN